MSCVSRVNFLLVAHLSKSFIFSNNKPKKLSLVVGMFLNFAKSFMNVSLRFARHSRKGKNKIILDVILWRQNHGKTKVGKPERSYIDQQMMRATAKKPPKPDGGP